MERTWKWPTLEKGQQVRIYNQKTKKFLYSPRGCGTRFDDTQYSVYPNFRSPGNYFCRTSDKGMEDIVIEVVELQPVSILRVVK